MSVVVTCLDPAAVAGTVAIQLRAAVWRMQTDRDRIVQICLPGGRVENEVYRQLAGIEQDHSGVDWTRVEFWWGDEGFVPVESPDRNAGHSLALLAAGISLAPSRVHPMPSSGAGNSDPRQAALHYASELGDTVFDICLLGMGEDGHVASLFPGHPAFDPRTTSRVVGVTGVPTPPPERMSLTVPAINDSTEVWIVVAGADKAEATARALGGDKRLPAAVVAGRQRTVWFLDAEAASQLD